jgi:glycosyltransferase involved in cell wall biosynthesis
MMQDATLNHIKISAILPNYNMVELIKRAIRSLLSQTESFTEIIIVDDGSTDESVKIINSYVDKYPHIRLVKHVKNQGVIAALNTGIAHAKGDYIMLCAADDFYGDKIVEKSRRVITDYPGVGVICGDAVVERFDLEQPFYRTLPFPADVMIQPEEFKAMASKGYVGFNGGGGMLINRQVIVDAGMLLPETRWHGDWVLYFVAAFRRGVYYMHEIFTHINMRQASYAEGKKDDNQQNQVMLDTVHLIQKNYPDLWNHFRAAGLLPHYHLRYIKLFVADPIARKFITPRLLWKLLINNAMVVRVGRLFPYRFILGVRKFLKA